MRPASAGDASVPHRPAPPVALAKAYQDTEQQKPNLSRNSSSSSSSSPVQEQYEPKQSPPAQSLVIHDQDTGAIYEEINDDIVSIIPLAFD